jgi:hypothetical protein
MHDVHPIDPQIRQNARVLEAELSWLHQVVETRIKLQFGQDCGHRDVFDIPPPAVEADGSMYGRFLHHYGLTAPERLLLVLSLAPHLRPQLLDIFLARNSAEDREFTEFGGRNGYEYAAFLPTGETALFVLAGEDLGRRLTWRALFDEDHVFARHNIVSLRHSEPGEPLLSGFLELNPEIIDLLTLGVTRPPKFGAGFPARRIETAQTWEDLVLEPHTLEQVLEIGAWIEHGNTLLYELGLARKVQPGYRSLFYGPSGTGKTLTAALLGKMAGHEVYRIDLSLVISKYIGETEKNLEGVFRQAESKNWILFFDEADALFGKRTAVSDAHDRFANQEVSYLLQRVEEYPGVVILASNMRSNLDDAFARRFQSIIHFPMPKPGERLRLWQGSFSPKTRLHDSIDLGRIAAEYELSGGGIVNVVRYATLMALKNQRRTILRNDLLDGIKREYQKEGKTF